MVKKFIGGLLKKKETTNEVTNNNIPDELPSLAEDVVLKKETAKPGEKAPEKKIDEKPLEKKIPPKPTPREKPPEERKKKHTELSKIKETLKTLEKPVYDSKKETTEGFFSEILNKIKKTGFKESILNQDLLSKMNEYWKGRKISIKHGTLLSAEQKLHQDVIEELNQLETLENKWHTQKIILEEDKKFLNEREHEIKTKVNELNRLLKELKFYQNVSEEYSFYLKDGRIIRNLKELLDILKNIDKGTFKHHVNANKNDFSNWIKDVLNEHELAEKIKKSKSKEEMIKILKDSSA